MNYSDTYFELDTLIVTLSVVCTLKGTCQYTLLDVGSVEIHSIYSIECIEYCTKDQSNVKGVEDTLYGFQCIKYLCNAMYVEDIKDGVCGFYATLYTE